MSAFDPARLRTLARLLRVPARQLPVLAARLMQGEGLDETGRRRALDAARVPGDAAETVSMLLMTPIASFAQDDLATALAVRPTGPQSEDA